jgi:aryl-alcohol dehydrogenase-like predicted oxidoreductase
MNKRRLGTTRLEVAPLGLGGSVFGWTADERTTYELLDAFVGAGFNLVDTADVYSYWAPGNSGGESETLIGKWMKRRGNRDRVVVATKVGSPMGPDRKGLKKRYVLEAAEDSLRRLQTDYIDLYQSHSDDPDASQEETLEAYERLLHEGKVRTIGVSRFSPARIREAFAISDRSGLPSYQVLQPPYNLYDRASYEAELEPFCVERGLGVICYYPLASGFLSGKYRDASDLADKTRRAWVEKYLNQRGLRILEALDDVASAAGSKPATVALAWLMARPSVAAPIASATSVAQLHELMAAAELELDSAALARLDRASDWRVAFTSA